MKHFISLLSASGLLASLVAAAPLEKRVYVYTTETIVETVDVTVTATIYGPAPTVKDADVKTTESASPTPIKHTPSVSPTIKAPPKPDVYRPHTPETSIVSTTSSTSSSVVEPVPTTTSSTHSSPPPPPAPTTTSTSSPPPPSTTTTSTPPPAYAPPAPTTTSTPPPPLPSTTITSPEALTPKPGPIEGTGGKCPPGAPCVGELTHYDTLYHQGAYGACGGQHDGKKEYVVALSHLLMGAKSNGNPFCDKYVSITYGGVTERAKVVDKCMGCAAENVDASEALFQRFADLGVGRLHKVKWNFVS